MSRSKADITDETIENVTETTVDVVESVNNEAEKKVVKPIPVQVEIMTTLSTAKKIGVVRYLQLYPQNSYVEAAMKFDYKSKVCAVDEWHKIVEKVKKKLGIK